MTDNRLYGSLEKGARVTTREGAGTVLDPPTWSPQRGVWEVLVLLDERDLRGTTFKVSNVRPEER